MYVAFSYWKKALKFGIPLKMHIEYSLFKRAASVDYHYLLHHTQDEKAHEYELKC